MVVGMGMKARDLKAAPPSNEGETITCVSCHGKKVNKRGKQCKKCKGTGQISTECFSELKSILNQEITSAVERILRE